VADEDDQWSEAGERARRAARDTRNRAIRAAFEAVRATSDREPDHIRDALIREMARRGVTDPRPEELSFLTDMVASPRRATIRWTVRMFGGWISLFRELNTYSQPRWMSTPKRVPSVSDDEPHGGDFAADLTAQDLSAGRSTIARVLADVRDQSEEGDDEQVRPVEVWMSLTPDTSIGVHIGTHQVAQLTGSRWDAVRAAIRRWGGGSNSLRAEADLLGSTPDTAHLDLWLPTPSEP
jgi:hypothetical protein